MVPERPQLRSHPVRWKLSRATAGVAALLLGAAGCQTVGQVATGVDEALYEAVPTHPVTGRPMANLVSEERELATAESVWQRVASAVRREGGQVDPPGRRLTQVQRVFSDLVAVAHRQHLPWEVHLLGHPMPNAGTPGGGMVFVFEGIFTDHRGGQGFVHPQDDAIAAVLAHEIAHVTLMHMAERETSKVFTDRHEEDPFYAASYSTADEAEADKLSVLYMALAGYDPRAAPRVWEEAHRRHGSNPGLYLYTHPLNADRIRLTAGAAVQVRQYYSRGERNPEWATVLHENPLFPRTAATGRQPGAGVLKGVGAALEAVGRHRAAKEEAEARERAALQTPEVQATRVRLLETKLDDRGRQLVWMQFQNGARYDVVALGVKVTYLGSQQALAEDPNCGGPASIRAGQTVWLACAYYPVRGADSFKVEITGVQFR
jgi:hypothetical protein